MHSIICLFDVKFDTKNFRNVYKIAFLIILNALRASIIKEKHNLIPAAIRVSVRARTTHIRPEIIVRKTMEGSKILSVLQYTLYSYHSMSKSVKVCRKATIGKLGYMKDKKTLEKQ